MKGEEWTEYMRMLKNKRGKNNSVKKVKAVMINGRKLVHQDTPAEKQKHKERKKRKTYARLMCKLFHHSSVCDVEKGKKATLSPLMY